MANWRLLGFSAVLGLGIPLVGVYSGFSRLPVQGRAELVEALPPGEEPAWQVVFDPVALGLSRPTSLSWLDDGERLKRALKHVFEIELDSNKFAGPASDSLQVLGKDFQTQPVLKRQRASTTAIQDPLFSGTPIVAAEWTDRANTVKFHLFRSSKFENLLSGRVSGHWNLDGFKPTGVGFALSDLGPIPRDASQVISVDSSALKFPDAQTAPLNKSLKRWELPNIEWALQQVGPNLSYLVWQERTFFSFGLRDPQAIQNLVAKRFPSAAIPTSVQRVGGVRIQGFDPNGPAWAFRGERVFASRNGGTAQLGRFVKAALSPRSPINTGFWGELERLAQTEPGWHLLIVREETKQGPPWAALLRWSSDSLVTGYLVVKPEF